MIQGALAFRTPCAGVQFASVTTCVETGGSAWRSPCEMPLESFGRRNDSPGGKKLHVLYAKKATRQRADGKRGTSWDKLEEMLGCSQPASTISCSLYYKLVLVTALAVFYTDTFIRLYLLGDNDGQCWPLGLNTK